MVGDRVLQEKYATTRDRTPTTKTPVQNPRIEGQGAEGMEFIYREGVGGGGSKLPKIPTWELQK